MLDDETIVSQCVLFILAGYGTTASALSYAVFLLAKHPGTQQRLRQEIVELIEKHGDVTYQGIMEAKFLDACIMGKSTEQFFFIFIFTHFVLLSLYFAAQFHNPASKSVQWHRCKVL